MIWTSKLIDYLEWYYPANLNPFSRLRAKTLVILLHLVVVCCLILEPLSVAFGSEFPYGISVIGAFLLLGLYKLTQSTTLVGNLAVALIYCTLVSTMFKSGGIYSHDLGNMYLVLMFAFSVTTIWSTVIWSLLCFGANIYFLYIAQDVQILSTFNEQRLGLPTVYYFIINTLSIIFPFIFLKVLSTLHKTYLKSMRETNKKLDESNKKLASESRNLLVAKSELEKSNLKLERYAHTVSHDLKQPIRTMKSFTQLLSKQINALDIKDEKVSEYMGYVESGTQRMSAQIDELLTFSMVSNDASRSTLCDVKKIIDEVLVDLSFQIKMTENTIEVGDMPQLKVMSSNLSQVFQNLISNALKYKKPTEALSLVISAEEKTGHWLFSIADNGLGIKASQLESIFNLYTQLNVEQEGQGIGLSSCKLIITGYGGHIWVESEVNVGSTFYFTFPK